jgi:hypothetical protein
MVDWFLNPAFLAAAAALVSVPIVIHLINRVRFKKIRWAAMEFLLKAQKRSRRRLIVEQLLLLFLRCLLIALTGFLVLRFVGFSFSDLASKQAMHIVLLDDTLSMNDTWKDNGVAKTSFEVAKKQIVLDTLVKALVQTNANDKLMLLPITKAAFDPDYQAKTYDRLSSDSRYKELKADLDALEPTLLHASMQQGVKKVQDWVNNNPEARVTLHIVSDFRQRDWARPDAEGLHQMLQSMAKSSRDFKVRMIDVAHPFWSKGQASPLSHDNVGILDLRAGTKVAGKSMPVNFTATIANFSGRDAEVNLIVYDDATGREMQEVDFNPPMPLKISPASTQVVTFEIRFNPNIKPNEPHFAQISARLKSNTLGDLENDGLAADNVRFASVEVREKVPILVIDGEGARSRTEFDKDSFFLQTAIISVPGANYDLVWGDELGGGVAVKALERSDLARFPSIFLMNVRELSPKQLTNLENYVRDGGGVCFFLGPQVSAKEYNKNLYKEGAGVFPVPLRETFTPPHSEEPRRVESNGFPQLLLQEEQFGSLDRYPIFGALFNKDSKQKNVLKDLPVRRYFQVPRAEWKAEPGKVFELATLPNDIPARNFQGTVLDLVRGRLSKATEAAEFAPYRKALDRHRRALEALVDPGSEKLAYTLAPAIDAMLVDAGDQNNREEFPSMIGFWSNNDPKIRSLLDELIKLRDQVKFGDPLIVASNFGKGKVVAVLTTAGKDWNDWAGGSEASLIYPAFIMETQNYISSQSSEDNRTVGGLDRLSVDAETYKGKQLKAQRTFMKAVATKEAEVVKQGDSFPVEGKGQLVFEFGNNDLPGLYIATVRAEDGANRPPLAVQGRTFNVDTAKEGSLERVSRDEIDKNVIGEFKEQIQFQGPDINENSLVTRTSDFSESPWLFLIFLFVLVTEQALAVHLSFHLKGDENQVLKQIARGS